ncbi:CBS-domain-containing protein [Deinococcus aerius]|uniref:CBS-domain-containing protein n=1 Tax=Deinococcus aerius TaxID=200253 RepID=A0A2I9D6W5_9DEIO|nr:CBS domain-containing protein [Deinococcus aerius]GBF06190.1 CBS-domain-containing protein [Deinococcus aerius]
MLVKDAMHPRVITASPYESLADIVVKMETLGVGRLPVVHEGRLTGIVTRGEVGRFLPPLHAGLTPWQFAHRVGSVRVGEVMRQPVLTALAEDPLERAIHVMLGRRVGGLPVLEEEGGDLVGMLTLTDVLRAEARAPTLQWGTVERHMTRQTVSTPAEAPASEAAAKLKISGLRVLPVLDQGRLVGVLHERDLSEAAQRAGASHGDTVLGDQFFLAGKAARDLMRLPQTYVLEHAPMRSAMTRMLEADVHGLPVIDGDGHLLGVVTISDVLRTLLGEQRADQA